MSVMDSTMIDMASKGATPGVVPPVVADKPASTEGTKAPVGDATSPGAKDRPASNDFVTSLLDKHGLTSPEELSEFIDNLAGLKGTIGDEDPEELLKAKETLSRYQKAWETEQEKARREKETPEETIKRLEKELKDEQARKTREETKARKAEGAKKAVSEYNATVAAVVASDPSIPPEYVPFINDFMGVDSPVNGINILDKPAVRKLAKEYGLKRLRAFEQLVIQRYRDGKAEIPQVPVSSSTEPPVTGETKPKNLTESRKLAHTMLSRLWGNKG